MQATILSAALLMGALVTTPPQEGGIQVDKNLPKYESVGGVSGNLKGAGSDTMLNLMTNWAEGFKRYYPNVSIEVEGKGSSSAPTALTEGTATFGQMSREMKDSELNEFEKRHGYKPTALPSSIDMLAVYVHKDNPIKGLTMQQVDAIFSKTRKGGHAKDIVTWGELGLTGEWASKPISLYGRNSVSGTYGYFKEHALFKGDFKDAVKEQPGSSAVVGGVANDRYAIGYSGIGYKTADVNAVPLAVDERSEFVEASAENAYTGAYPLARFLYVYVNYRPGSELDPLRREFVNYMYSFQGQEKVVDSGYLPIPATVARQGLDLVGLKLKPAETSSAQGSTR